ncbi:hypothetical protein [Azospirillum sp. ST 5-10]|uniref:hypothetical protein n=1 Tax=unclassified Azospirillum TaxID=2630922 RepID=UPI003F4A6F59
MEKPTSHARMPPHRGDEAGVRIAEGIAEGIAEVDGAGWARDVVPAVAAHGRRHARSALSLHVDLALRRAERAGGRPEGRGAGSWLVRSLLGAHGGSIAIDSAPGAGATFSVRMPVDATSSGQSAS